MNKKDIKQSVLILICIIITVLSVTLISNAVTTISSDITTGGNVGIGTTTPNWSLQSAGSAPVIALTDTSAGVNDKHWLFQSNAGNLHIGTSTDDLSATSSYITINNNGNVGIGTSTPEQVLVFNGSSVKTDFYLGDDRNTFFGVGAAGAGNLTHTATTEGWDNTLIGYHAGQDITIGLQNVAIGSQAGENLTSGHCNVYIGNDAGFEGTSAQHNVAIGTYSLKGITSGDHNISIGYDAGRDLTVGESNVIIGAYAGHENITGNYNVMVGRGTGYWNTSSSNNILIGYQAGIGSSGNSLNQDNVVIGHQAGLALTTGDDNVLLGYQAGDSLTTGINNIIIGNGQDSISATTDDYLNIGGVIHSDLSSGNVGIGTTSPAGPLDVYTTATTTMIIDSNNAAKGSCLKFKDVDGGGYTYCYFLDGNISCSTNSCE